MPELKIKNEDLKVTRDQVIVDTGELGFEKIRVLPQRKLTYIFNPAHQPRIERSLDIFLEEGAESLVLGTFFETGETVLEVSINTHHLGQRSKGETLIKGVIGGTTTATIRGLVRIEKEGQFSEDSLAEHVLLLSKTAQAEALPHLEIETNDVKAGHAATVSKLDEDQLFYLMSRGIDRAAAEDLLVQSFLSPVIDRIRALTAG